MSWQAVRAVLSAKVGPPKGRKIVLVALAEHADANGEHSFPGLELLSRETELDGQRILRHIASLKAGRLISQTRRGHEGQRAEFTVNLARLVELTQEGGADDTHSEQEGGADDTKRVAQMTQEGGADDTPSVLEPSMNHPSSARSRGAMESVILEAFGWDRSKLSPPERRRLARAATDLTQTPDATVEEIRRRRGNLQESWSVPVTPWGLVDNWTASNLRAGQQVSRGAAGRDLP